MQAKKIKLIDKTILSIHWDDNELSEINLQKLRKLCPCATCLAEREKQSSSYIPIFSGSQLQVKDISVVGNYALSILWNDGHNTGIYEFPFLKNLASN